MRGDTPPTGTFSGLGPLAAQGVGGFPRGFFRLGQSSSGPRRPLRPNRLPRGHHTTHRPPNPLDSPLPAQRSRPAPGERGPPGSGQWGSQVSCRGPQARRVCLAARRAVGGAVGSTLGAAEAQGHCLCPSTAPRPVLVGGQAKGSPLAWGCPREKGEGQASDSQARAPPPPLQGSPAVCSLPHGWASPAPSAPLPPSLPDAAHRLALIASSMKRASAFPTGSRSVFCRAPNSLPACCGSQGWWSVTGFRAPAWHPVSTCRGALGVVAGRRRGSSWLSA